MCRNPRTKALFEQLNWVVTESEVYGETYLNCYKNFDA